MRITHILRDVSNGIDVAEWELASAAAGYSTGHNWNIKKRRLRELVDVVQVDSGEMQFTIVPSRGMSIWKARCGDVNIGWDSRVHDITSPSEIDLAARNGLGWLDGFGGWIVRCGLASIGPPCRDQGDALTLHGRIDYTEATYVEAGFDSEPMPRIFVRGTVVDQSGQCSLEMHSETSIAVGSRRIEITDEIVNVGATPCEMQMLYHINFGHPFLGAGSRFFASIAEIHPRDARAAESPQTEWTHYFGPQGAGYTEQAYFMRIPPTLAGRSEVLLRSPANGLAALLEFEASGLPCFTLWKNEATHGLGYVTGLEPGTSFPNIRPTERAAGRVPVLDPGASQSLSLSLNILQSGPEVNAAISRIL